jgi:uncharacterized membrane protein
MVLSLALNLFLVAFVGAQAWRARNTESMLLTASSEGGITAHGILRQLADKLPPEDGRLLRDAFAARLPELATLRRQSVQAMDRVRDDIARRPFDADRTRADMRAAREARRNLAPVIEETMLDVLPRMSDEGRIALGQYRLAPRR